MTAPRRPRAGARRRPDDTAPDAPDAPESAPGPGSDRPPPLGEDDAPDRGREGAPAGASDDAASDRAAAAALARAREAARAKGLRPGSRPAPRARRRPADPVFSGSSTDGRDPLALGDQLDRLLLDQGWKLDVQAGAVMGRWAAIVGAEVADHCTPVTFEDGVLLVRAESTAWATQLRLDEASLLARLAAEAGPGVVTRVRIVGPSAPSWARGPRRVRGRGPRDTYG